jgi:alkanesulfonate monooxygenase SsuD/methylene tetrahydromethanopterin reductase-like flavin-dependent oxidoreductase (luciferase family)
MARPMKVGLVLPMLEVPPTGEKPTWDAIRAMALRAEEVGFDTVWIPDELLWRPEEWPGPRGFWECVAMTGAVAAVTSRIEVGTWVLSALHRNPGLTAKAVETLDEVSGGRFLLGLGSGHAGQQGKAFGYPLDHTIGRYEEALQIIVPLLREGHADFTGKYHAAVDQQLRPRGPRPNRIPIMLGAHKARTMGLAVRHADIWSAFATESSLPEAFEPMLQQVDAVCAEQGRDPASLGRSVGVIMETTDHHGAEEAGMGVSISGSPQEIAATLRQFAELGFTRVEIMLWENNLAGLEGLAAVLPLLDD